MYLRPARCGVRCCLASIFALALVSFSTPLFAVGALAVGKCGAYGVAFDYASEAKAKTAALKQCKGECAAVTMRKACAALSLDMTNPCGSFGYAIAPRISGALNAASRKCYDFGGKECVIRAWTCDAKG